MEGQLFWLLDAPQLLSLSLLHAGAMNFCSYLHIMKDTEVDTAATKIHVRLMLLLQRFISSNLDTTCYTHAQSCSPHELAEESH